MKTYVAKDHEVDRKWYIIDAEGRTLGRMATEIARILKGKHKAEYTPHCDTGDYVIVINADKVKVTGQKASKKTYWRHSGYMGGMSYRTFEEMQKKFPGRVVEKAVKGMLPHNALGRRMFKKLKVYAGPDHNHEAQKPEVYDF